MTHMTKTELEKKYKELLKKHDELVKALSEKEELDELQKKIDSLSQENEEMEALLNQKEETEGEEDLYRIFHYPCDPVNKAMLLQLLKELDKAVPELSGDITKVLKVTC